MKLRNKYKAITGLLIAAGMLTGCVGAQQSGGGATSTAAAIQASEISTKLFVQNTNLSIKLEAGADSNPRPYYASGTKFIITNNGSQALDLSKSTITLTAQDMNGNSVNLGSEFQIGWVSAHQTGYKVAFTRGNGNIQVGQVVATSNGVAAMINPGETITLSGGINLNGSPFNLVLAQSTLSIDGAAPAPSPTPDPTPSPEPTPSPTPSDDCKGVATWNTDTTYAASGTKVVYQNIEYSNGWWTKGDNPSQNSGAVGSGKVWTIIGSCGGTPTPTPTPAPTPAPELGELNLIVDTTNTNCKSSTECSGLKVHVANSSGTEVATVTVPDANLGGVLTQPIKNLQVGVVYTVTADAISNSNQSFDPITGKVTVVKDSAVNMKVSYDKVAVNTGSATIVVPNVLSSYTGDLQLKVINNVTGATVATSAVKQGNSITFNDLPASDAAHQYSVQLLTGLADPVQGLYYVVSGNTSLTITKNTTTTFNLSLLKSSKATHKVVVSVSGLVDSDKAKPTFDDASSTYAYVQPVAILNGTVTYFVESGLNFGVALKATGVNNYQQSQFSFTGVINTDTVYSANFTKQDKPLLTYDYKVWFKDYNNKFDIMVNGVDSGKSITFTSNAKLASSLWGNCFGQTLTNDMATVKQVGDVYETTLTAKEGTFNFAQQCTLMYDDKTSEVLPGSGGAAHNLMVTSMLVDGVTAPINQPCAANDCKDPGNGYVNAGYYAQWAVWGRAYNPNTMPFDSINDIIYAFIGFDPATGNLKTLDSAADSWGLAATSRALLQYPYMHAHLSFGGWTNNGVNTAPMFQKLSENPDAMKAFAKQAVELMKKNKFTGLDIDWEWWSDYANSVAPAKNMLAFYKVLRAELDAASKIDNKHYTLTIAVNAGVDRVNAMQNPANPNSVADFWKQVNGLVDQVNLMSYDYHGAYDQDAAYFHSNYDFANVPANKQAAVGQTTGWSIKAVTAAYQANGVEAKKLVIGLPIYARTMQVTSAIDGGLLQPITGAGFGDYEKGVLDYKCLINPVADPVTGCGMNVAPNDVIFYSANSTGAQLAAFDKYGREALQPWGYSPSTNTFVTFDDKWSVQAKTQKVIDGKMGGTMFWELDGDSTDPAKSLLRATAAIFRGK